MASRTEIIFAACAIASTLACGFHDPVVDDVGDAVYCDDVAQWEGDWSALELDLIQEVNALRGAGGSCDGEEFDFVVELDLSPQLRCAARHQARDMARRRELGHLGLDGSEFLQRADMAEYGGVPRAELLAVGQADSAAVVDEWQTSPAHCAELHESDLHEVGAGVFQTQDTLWWVLTAGTRR